MTDKNREEFRAWHSEQVSRLFDNGEPTAASVWAGFKSLLEITWKAARAEIVVTRPAKSWIDTGDGGGFWGYENEDIETFLASVESLGLKVINQ